MYICCMHDDDDDDDAEAVWWTKHQNYQQLHTQTKKSHKDCIK